MHALNIVLDYMTYAYRPNNGSHVLRNDVKLCSDMVVPYNQALLFKHNCHIDVEIISTIQAVKYLHILKGGTRAAVTVESRAPNMPTGNNSPQ